MWGGGGSGGELPLLSARRNTISRHLSSIAVIQTLSFIPRRATPAVQLHPQLIDLLRFADSLAYERAADTIYSVVRGIGRESRSRVASRADNWPASHLDAVLKCT